MDRKNESGNALWFILIGIVLLGVLTALLTRSGTSVDQSGNFEQNRIKAGQLMRYAKSLESAIQDMRLRGISENDISFANATTVTSYTNASCDAAGDPSFPDCLLFDVTGAGLSYREIAGANDGSDWIFSGANNVGTTAGPVGTTAARSGNDLMMLLPNATTALCLQINRDLDVGTAGTMPVDTTGIATTAFTGAYAAGGPVILDGDPAPFELNNENAGCFTDDASGITYFYYVLIAR